ncbi:hypothetical protein PR048_030899 [Dryococelus australis]|uniref:Uncharacterized protein n=1 Tax=Dryococelus australis TaxID=614101 RepID=A0ABQ9GE09_9NEOP|nr:hypothetical protein PR048_030899 [Dryococelus australis]
MLPTLLPCEMQSCTWLACRRGLLYVGDLVAGEALRGGRRTTTRVTESLRVTEVARRVSTTPLLDDAAADAACCYRVLQPDGDDYKLVFISSDSSSKEEEEEEEEDSDGDDADTSSTASSAAAGFSLDDCDWDYFEASAEGPRGTLGRPRPPTSCIRSVAACTRSRRTSCEACGALGLGPGLYGVPVPIPVPVPVPIPVPVLWAAPDVHYGDDPSGGVRIRIRSIQRPPAVSQVVLGPWRAPVISPDKRDSAVNVDVSVAEKAMPAGGGDAAEDSIVLAAAGAAQVSAAAPPSPTERREWFSDSSTDGDAGRASPTAAKRPQLSPPQQQLQSRTCGGRRRRGEDMLPSWGSSSASSDSDSDSSQPLVGEYRFNDSSAAAESSDDEDGHFSEVLVVNDGGSGEDHDEDDGGVTVVLTRVKHLLDADVEAPDVRLKTAAVIEVEAKYNVCSELGAPPDDDRVGSYNVVLKCVRALDGDECFVELQRGTTHNSPVAQVITTDSDNCDKPTITQGDDNVDTCVKMTASGDGEAGVIVAESGNEAGVTFAGSDDAKTDLVVCIRENDLDAIATTCENSEADVAAVHNEDGKSNLTVLSSENNKAYIGDVCSKNKEYAGVDIKNSKTNIVAVGIDNSQIKIAYVGSEDGKADGAAVSSGNSNADVVVLDNENTKADVTAVDSENINAENETAVDSENSKANVTAEGSENIKADVTAVDSENIKADVTAVGSKNINAENETAMGSENMKADVTAVGSENTKADVTAVGSENVKVDVTAVGSENINAENVTAVGSENIKADVTAVDSENSNTDVIVLVSEDVMADVAAVGSENISSTDAVVLDNENSIAEVAVEESENKPVLVHSGIENSVVVVTPVRENSTGLVTPGSENKTALLISGSGNTSADLVKEGNENSKTNIAVLSSEDCKLGVETAESEKSKEDMAVVSSDKADMEIVSSDDMADMEILISDDMADIEIKSSDNGIADTVVVDSDNNVTLATVGSEDDKSSVTTVNTADAVATENENGKAFLTTAGSENNTADVKAAGGENNTVDVKIVGSENNTAYVKSASSENVSADVTVENGKAGVTTASSENVQIRAIVADSEDEIAEGENTQTGSENAGDYSLAAGSDVFEQGVSNGAGPQRRRSMDDELRAVARRRRAVSPPGVAPRNHGGWRALPAYDVHSPGLVELARGTQVASCPDIPSAVVSEPGPSLPAGRVAEVCRVVLSEQGHLAPEEQRTQVSVIPGDDIERSKCHDQLVSESGALHEVIAEDVAGVESERTAGCVESAQESAETVACAEWSVQPASCDDTPGGHVQAAECKSGPCDEESGTESWSDSRRWGDAPKESSDIEEDAARESIGGRAASPVEKGASDGRGYTSLVMITQDACPKAAAVSVVASDTTTVVPGDVVVSHTNWQHPEKAAGLAGYFTLTLEADSPVPSTRRPLVTRKTPEVTSDPVEEQVKVVTGADTLSAVVCLEEGLADDDSWVEEIDDRTNDDEDFAMTTPTEDSSSDEGGSMGSYGDREEELRGYHRTAIDFTLFTIVEESCEESEVEQGSNKAKKKQRPVSSSELEKYFFYGLGGGPAVTKDTDSLSDSCSSVYSESMESLRADDINEEEADPAELASSRLEKYFHSEFMMFGAENRESDGSGSVGSDSEGRPSPEQRRKRLVRARNMGRSHGSSLEHLDHSGSEQHSAADTLVESDGSSTETDTHDELAAFDGPFDMVKRKKKKRSASSSELDRRPTPTEFLEKSAAEDARVEEGDLTSDEEGSKTPQPEFLLPADLSASRNKQQSRDSGFVGSCDDLLKEQRSHSDSSSCSNSVEATRKVKPGSDGSPCGSDSERPPGEVITSLTVAVEGESPSPMEDQQASLVSVQTSTPPAAALSRKDSFNNWSSDEETNLMMSKMRAFFKTMVAANSGGTSGKGGSSPGPTQRCAKPPQLVYFENELTQLMKTVPGIRDDQVKEIVEYLSSEDTWSDSYDSSDYTSSDLEGAAAYYQHAGRSELQEQISASCQQIIDKFDVSGAREVGESPEHQLASPQPAVSRDTALVYQRLVASFGKMAGGGEQSTSSDANSTPHSSPPLIAKVMHHIGSRLVALMHEVSGGEGGATPGPRPRHQHHHHHHRRLQQKISSTSTTTEEDDSHTDTESDGKLCLPATYCGLLPRSKSHDVLLEQEMRAHQKESLRSSSSGVSDMAEEREASDCERFSWRGSFESALMVPDSRTKLSLLSGGDGSTSGSALALAAKRRSAGDLLLASSARSCSREQLDRVRSCGSIGGGGGEERIWGRRRGSVPDASAESGDGDEEGDDDEDDDEVEDEADDPRSARSTTLPRSLQQTAAVGGGGTNSLPRLPAAPAAASSVPSTPHIHKAHSVQHFLQSGNVKSARYRPPGFSRPAAPKRAVSAPGLQPQHPRSRRRPHQLPSALLATGEYSATTSSSGGGNHDHDLHSLLLSSGASCGASRHKTLPQLRQRVMLAKGLVTSQAKVRRGTCWTMAAVMRSSLVVLRIAIRYTLEKM